MLSIGAATGADDDHFGNLARDEYDRAKVMLDALHLKKIDMADEVLILNVAGYIGESTGLELAYAKSKGKVIRFLVDPQLADDEHEAEKRRQQCIGANLPAGFVEKFELDDES